MAERQTHTRDEIAERLIALIQEEGLPAHAKLPSERELVKRWAINRLTLRAALDRLISQNIIYSVYGRGYFVREKRLVRNLQDIRPLNQLAAEQGLTLKTVILKQKVVKADRSVADYLEVERGAEVLEVVRMRYIDTTPAVLETIYVGTRMMPGIEDLYNENASLYSLFEKVYGYKPIYGWQRLSVSFATANESALLQIPKETPVVFLRGTTYAQGMRKPIDYFSSVNRIDRMMFSSTIQEVNTRRKE